MANIAEGSFDVVSDSPELLTDLEQKVLAMADRPMFSYGSMGTCPEVGIHDGMLSVVFTARWNCALAFSWLESLLDPAENYAHREALIRAEISGEGRETAMLYKEQIEKLAGDTRLSRNQIDLESSGFWGALSKAQVLGMTTGERRKDIGDCLVDFVCHEREILDSSEGQGGRTRLKLGVYFQCQATECVVVLDENGAVVESSYKDEYGNTAPEDSRYFGEMLQDLGRI